MENVVELNEKGFAVTFDDYVDLRIPKDCVGFTERALEDLCALADERESITVEEGNEIFKAVGDCLIDVREGKLVLGCKNSKIPDDGTVRIIGVHAFRGIGGLESENRDIFTNIQVPESVETIEHHAFCDSGLTDIQLPKGLKKIGSMAFMLTRIGKEGTTIFLPETVEEMGIGVFAGCKELCRSKIFSERYKSECDCIVDRATKTIIAVHNGISGEILPPSADKIEMLTFMGQNKGAKYYFHENIKEISVSPLGMPSAIEFPITMVVRKGSYSHEFALKHNINHEIW